jgi:hypothetical protein
MSPTFDIAGIDGGALAPFSNICYLAKYRNNKEREFLIAAPALRGTRVSMA